MSASRPEDVFEGHPAALAAFRAVEAMVLSVGPSEVVVSRTQVAFRRRRGFAYVWAPGRWLRRPRAEAVLSIALSHRLDSTRFKEVSHPTQSIWMHHLEIRALAELDAEVLDWLREAWVAAV